jgi:hypothetical protein
MGADRFFAATVLKDACTPTASPIGDAVKPTYFPASRISGRCTLLELYAIPVLSKPGQHVLLGGEQALRETSAWSPSGDAADDKIGVLIT